jgi:Na+/melibiose symporter-like transporter
LSRLSPLTPARLGCFAALQFALSFAALPLLAFLPADYARRSAMSLGLLGLLLLGARLFDAVVDPPLGLLADHALAQGKARRVMLAWALPMAAGFAGLMALPSWLDYQAHRLAFIAALLALLTLTYAGYSALGLLHQAWALRLGNGAEQQARVFAWREGLGLAGVLVASAAAGTRGPLALALAFSAALGLALLLLRAAPLPQRAGQAPRSSSPGRLPQAWQRALLPLRQPRVRRLLAVYLAGATAASVPATLVMFFVRDRIQAPDWAAGYLLAYFAAGAAGMPLWLRAVRRLGAARAWLAGTLLAIASFGFAALLQPGQRWGFALVCAASGLCLGADLAIPPALLGQEIAAAGHGGHLEGSYFGVWNLATKLALALAAGLALPLLQWLGYRPGQPQLAALPPLVVAYCLLPCALKALSALLLWRGWIAGTQQPPHCVQPDPEVPW